jgi:uncharacterized protein (TIGR00369 family)
MLRGTVSDGQSGRYETVPPVQAFLGFELDLDGDASTIEVPLTDNVRGWGPVHGGVLALLADTCCAGAVMSVVDVERELPASTDIHVRYFRQPREGPLRAKGTVVSRGSRTVAAESEIRDGQDRLIAKATGSYTLFEFQKRTDIHPSDSEQPAS